MNKTLVSLDSKGKIRVVEINYEWTGNAYTIHRTTYQLGGKKTQQPDIIVDKGKAKRTVSEQVKLQFDSHVKKYLDKGYKEWENELDDAAIREVLGDIKTGQDGMIKPMLAKQADKVANKFFDRDFYGSRKINGTRCLIYYKDNEVHTSSRGAINYDLAICHIIDHPILTEFLKKHPSIILDGEIYRFGWPLSKISGLCRHIEKISQTEPLEFYWYDIYDQENPDLIFADRLESMEHWANNELQLKEFDPEREWEKDELKIQFLPQTPMSGWSTIKKYHDQFVSEGWEGLVIRKIDAVYGPGKRSNDMIKVKEYDSETFKVIGIEDGLRKYEDFVFVVETKDGKTFKAKPHGSLDIRKDYYDNFEAEYKNHLADIKFFEYSPYGIPEQPSLIGFRFDLE